METILTLVVVIVLAFVIISMNKTNIPKKLKTDFAQRFPKAKNLDWSHNNQMYEVTFFDDEKEKKARYDADFSWVETKSILFRDNLPENVYKVVEQKYPECQYSDVSFIENHKGQKYYKLIVFNEGINFMLKINEAFDIIQTRNLTYDKMSKFKDESFFKGNDLYEA